MKKTEKTVKHHKVVELERRRLAPEEKKDLQRAFKEAGNIAGAITIFQKKHKVHVSNGNAWIICTKAGQKWREQGGKSDKKLASEKAEKKGKAKSHNKKESALAALKRGKR